MPFAIPMVATIIVPAQTLVLQRCWRAAGLETRFSPPSSMGIVRSEWPLWVDIVEKGRRTIEQALVTESHFMARLYPESGFGTGLLTERYSTQPSSSA